MSKILIMDDEVSIRNLCYEFLSKEGHSVITSARGDHAIAMLPVEKPDLVVMDIHIPGENGLSLLKKIRKLHTQLPVVVFSGSVTAELEKEAYEAGASEVIQKGSSFEELHDKIQKVLAAKDRLFKMALEVKRDEKILVVDDEDAVRGLLTVFFTRKGFNVKAAKSGEEAISIAQEFHPSMVLLDVMMPGMDGLLTLKKLREIDPQLGVVMATGAADEQIAKEAIACGAYHYVLKPFDLKYLELVVLTRLVIAS